MEDGDVNRARGPIQYPLAEAQSNRRGNLKPGAAEAAIQPETFRTDRADQRVLIRGKSIVAGMGRMQMRILHRRYTAADAIDRALDEAGARM